MRTTPLAFRCSRDMAGTALSRFLFLAAVALAIALALVCFRPQSALAQDDTGADTGAPVPAMPADESIVKPCSSCHEEEFDAWLASPHADLADPETGLAAATCTSCHGEYTRGHPDEDLVPLIVDSSSCQDCHADTFTQWEGSLHGEEGVQCISCHLPHSQEMRLTDERMCTSCHQESLDDSLHTAHWQGEASCTDCHMAGSVETMTLASAGSNVALINPAAPSHDFVTVSADKCLDCHREDVKLGAASRDAQQIAYAEAMQKLPEVTAALEQEQIANRRLGFFSVANLGFGVGLGGILGIVFMVVYARWFRNNAHTDGGDRS